MNKTVTALSALVLSTAFMTANEAKANTVTDTTTQPKVAQNNFSEPTTEAKDNTEPAEAESNNIDQNQPDNSNQDASTDEGTGNSDEDKSNTQDSDEPEEVIKGISGTSEWTFSNGELHFGKGALDDANMPNIDKDKVKNIIFDDVVVAPKYSGGLFSGYGALKSFENLDRLDTSNVTDMTEMFSGIANSYDDYQLESLDLSNFNTSKVENMSYMFANANVKNLDLTKFDVSAVKSMYWMFASSKVNKIEFSKWNSSSVDDMSHMFQETNFLENLDVSNFDTSNVTDMSYMFYGSGVKQLDLSHWKTPNVKNLESMFSFALLLSDLDVSTWDTSKVEDMALVFESAVSLKSLDLTSWSTESVIPGGMRHLFNFVDPSTSYLGQDQNFKDFDTNVKFKMKSLTLGPNFKFKNSDFVISGIDFKIAISKITDIDNYTGQWQIVGAGTEGNPLGKKMGTSEEFENADLQETGVVTYVWEPVNRVIDKPTEPDTDDNKKPTEPDVEKPTDNGSSNGATDNKNQNDSTNTEQNKNENDSTSTNPESMEDKDQNKEKSEQTVQSDLNKQMDSNHTAGNTVLAATNSGAAQLPQTGEKNNKLSMIGGVLISIIGLTTLLFTRRRKED